MFEPVSVKVLKLLKSDPRRLSPSLIADSIREEPKYVNRALGKLVEQDVLIEEGDFIATSSPPIMRNSAQSYSSSMIKLSRSSTF